MDFTTTRALNTLFSLINKTVRNIIEYNMQHSDFPLSPERVEQYVTKRLLVNIIWAFSGDGKLDFRAEKATSFANRLVSVFLLLPKVGRYWTTTSRSTMANEVPGNPRFPLSKSSLMRLLLPTSLFLPWIPFATKRSCTHGSPNTNLSCFVVLLVPVRP